MPPRLVFSTFIFSSSFSSTSPFFQSMSNASEAATAALRTLVRESPACSRPDCDSSGSSSGRTTTTASATSYNSDDFADTAKNVTGGNNQNVSTGSYKSRVHGNIGVTTTQQMLKSEREVAEFCMVDYIVNDFISRFCVMVY